MYEAAVDLLALGLDPSKATLFVQSESRVRAETLGMDCLRPPSGGWHGSGHAAIERGRLAEMVILMDFAAKRPKKCLLGENSSDVIKKCCDVTIICEDS